MRVSGVQIRQGEAGQVLPLAALLMIVALGVAIAATRAGSLVDDAARARTAADAAALAGAADGRDAAVELARSNGGELLSFERIGNTVLVTVRVDHATQSASAAAALQYRVPG